MFTFLFLFFSHVVCFNLICSLIVYYCLQMSLRLSLSFSLLLVPLIIAACVVVMSVVAIGTHIPTFFEKENNERVPSNFAAKVHISEGVTP